jgi:hypothetical protein
MKYSVKYTLFMDVHRPSKRTTAGYCLFIGVLRFLPFQRCGSAGLGKWKVLPAIHRHRICTTFPAVQCFILVIQLLRIVYAHGDLPGQSQFTARHGQPCYVTCVGEGKPRLMSVCIVVVRHRRIKPCSAAAILMF